VSTLVTNIGQLVTWDDEQPVRSNAALVVDRGRVAWVGSPAVTPLADDRIDVEGGTVIPGFVDSHTHLVFGGDRAAEFEARLAGEPYAAGGIRATVDATRTTPTPQLRMRATRLAAEALRSGTTTLEIKSGYGLSVPDELRSLEVAATLTAHRTFLGAHVVPDGGDAPSYVSLVAGPMLDAVAGVATAIDAFCEEGAFDEEQCREVLTAGASRGLGVHVHANQLRPGPGVQLAASLGALSADHCTFVDDVDVAALRDAGTVAVLVPAAEFSTRSVYAPARRLVDAGVTVALATDCNPGTSFTTSMAFVIALACREQGLTPLEALRAATAGGATALGQKDVGRRSGAHGDATRRGGAMNDPLWPRASDWLAGGGAPDGPRLGVVGVPLSRTSISPSGAEATPAAVRGALRRFATFHAGLDVDLESVSVHDEGDLRIVELDGRAALSAVDAGLSRLPAYDLVVLLGGDNALTWPAMRTLLPLPTSGLLTLDAHHDVRGFHAGPTNGNPVRGLIEDGLRGSRVVQVGLGNLTNSRAYRTWCVQQGIELHGVAAAQAEGVRTLVRRSLDRLAQSCDAIYVDLDVDVVDRAFVPGCPGARPGGLLPAELLKAAEEAGRHPAVRAVDIVEVDATADPTGVTVDLAAMCLLSVAAGLAAR